MEKSASTQSDSSGFADLETAGEVSLVTAENQISELPPMNIYIETHLIF